MVSLAASSLLPLLLLVVVPWLTLIIRPLRTFFSLVAHFYGGVSVWSQVSLPRTRAIGVTGLTRAPTHASGTCSSAPCPSCRSWPRSSSSSSASPPSACSAWVRDDARQSATDLPAVSSHGRRGAAPPPTNMPLVSKTTKCRSSPPALTISALSSAVLPPPAYARCRLLLALC